MKIIANLCAAACIILASSVVALATYHHVIVKPIITVFSSSSTVTGGGGAALAGGAGAVAAGQGVLVGFVAWCGANQPKRNGRRDTWTDNRHGAHSDPSQYNARAEGCLIKKKKKHKRSNTVSVRA